MTRYEWRTIREAEMNEMRQRQIKLGKRRQRGRDEALIGILTIIAAIGFIILAQFTDFADTAFVLFAIIFSISGISDLIRGIRRWIK